MKGCSEKWWQQKQRRKLRRAARVAVATGREPPDDKAFGGWPYSPSDGILTFWHVPRDERAKIMRK